MDNTELHYITYDPDDIWGDMMDAYKEAGGETLYPGDEKEILLRAVQQIIVQAFAKIDNALRMDTLEYASGEYLDQYGQKRNCARIPSAPASAVVTITFRATETGKTIPAGSAMTADGTLFWKTVEDIVQTGFAQTVTAEIVCTKSGSGGNGLEAGTEMQFLTPQDAITQIIVTTAASGGQNRESDETYRERIRKYGLANLTTGPETQYESAAMNVTSVIIDANAVNGGGGTVNIYLLLSDTTGSAAIIAAVEEALNAENVRPLTDTVHVALATAVEYTLNVEYQAEDGAAASDIAAAAAEYQKWQEETIGRAFNPDKLKAMLYAAGATRVEWGEGSAFDGGDVEYTEIDADEYCSGTISLDVMST